MRMHDERMTILDSRAFIIQAEEELSVYCDTLWDVLDELVEVHSATAPYSIWYVAHLTHARTWELKRVHAFEIVCKRLCGSEGRHVRKRCV